MKKRRKWTNNLKKRFLDLFKCGFRSRDVAKALGMSINYVYEKKNDLQLFSNRKAKCKEFNAGNFWREYQYMCDVANKKTDYNSNYDTGNRLRKYLMSIKVFE